NNNALEPPATRQDEGDEVPYTLFVQQCKLSGGLNITTGAALPQTYNAFECFGFGGIPFRSYAFNGSAGQFVSTSVTSTTVDTFVRIYGPDGSVVENDDSQFEPLGSNSRVNRLLPVDGTYFVEVSTSPDGGPVDITSTPVPGFTVQAKSCPTTAV